MNSKISMSLGGLVLMLLLFVMGVMIGGIMVSLLGSLTGLSIIIGLATLAITGVVYSRARGYL